MANNAQSFQRGEHAGYEQTAWEGIQQTIEGTRSKITRTGQYKIYLDT